MRYILDVSGRDLKLIRASIVNFQRSLAISDQAEFDGLIDELDDCFLNVTRQKKEQLKSKVKRKWKIMR
jgi:AICAR transformylase/IMP cyclohydrolase PurH